MFLKTHFLLVAQFSHIFSITKRIYNIIHSSKHKQNPEKKSSNPDTSRDRDWCEGEIAIGAVGASREASIAIEASRDRRGAGDVGGQYRQARLWTISTLSSFFLPLSLSLALSLSLSPIFQGRKLFEVKMETEMISRCFGSHFRSTENAFQFDRI